MKINQELGKKFLLIFKHYSLSTTENSNAGQNLLHTALKLLVSNFTKHLQDYLFKRQPKLEAKQFYFAFLQENWQISALGRADGS
jgi:hypothetical protein